MLRLPLEEDDLVLFSPPAELRRKVAQAGGSIGDRDLFVKRVAAVGGDTVELLPTGTHSAPTTPWRPSLLTTPC